MKSLSLPIVVLTDRVEAKQPVVEVEIEKSSFPMKKLYTVVSGTRQESLARCETTATISGRKDRSLQHMEFGTVKNIIDLLVAEKLLKSF